MTHARSLTSRPAPMSRKANPFIRSGVDQSLCPIGADGRNCARRWSGAATSRRVPKCALRSPLTSIGIVSGQRRPLPPSSCDDQRADRNAVCVAGIRAEQPASVARHADLYGPLSPKQQCVSAFRRPGYARSCTLRAGRMSHAISPKGAMGLMQIMPSTWAILRARLRLGANPYRSARQHSGGRGVPPRAARPLRIAGVSGRLQCRSWSI